MKHSSIFSSLSHTESLDFSNNQRFINVPGFSEAELSLTSSMKMEICLIAQTQQENMTLHDFLDEKSRRRTIYS